jgi:apolipoprotein N-acyltransferase
VAWTAPAGDAVSVSLVQGNVPQDVKFDPAFRDRNFELYLRLIRESRGRVVVLPESAFPIFADEMPPAVANALLDAADARQGSVLVGMFTEDPPAAGTRVPRYYNSVVALGSGGVQLYRKRHLVPFGETIPLEPVVGWFIRSVLSIPLASQTAGGTEQPAIDVAGQRIAVNICYEDVFGADIRPQAATATLLVNVTNDAWYGHSLAAKQHDQIAAMRALESGRPLLRATNTGITSAIDHTGREIGRLPWFTTQILEVDVIGRTGLTPFVRWGDTVAVLASALTLVIAVVLARRATRGAKLPTT